jgi:hypothetical protein
MNVGANVPVTGVVPRCEFERFLTKLDLPEPCWKVPSGENDWCRAWLVPSEGEPEGDERMADTGRGFRSARTGDGDGEDLVKGLFRH